MGLNLLHSQEDIQELAELVEFLSDKKTQGGGAKCTAQCLNGATPGQYQYLSSTLSRQEQQILILLSQVSIWFPFSFLCI